MMRKTFLIICMIVFANYANNILAGNGDKAWISERFALCSQGCSQGAHRGTDPL
jgi:hypothetical protein